MLLRSNNSKKRTDYWGRTDQGLRGGMTCLFSCPMTCISMLSHASSGISNILLQGCHQSLITENLMNNSIFDRIEQTSWKDALRNTVESYSKSFIWKTQIHLHLWMFSFMAIGIVCGLRKSDRLLRFLWLVFSLNMGRQLSLLNIDPPLYNVNVLFIASTCGTSTTDFGQGNAVWAEI